MRRSARRLKAFQKNNNNNSKMQMKMQMHDPGVGKQNMREKRDESEET